MTTPITPPPTQVTHSTRAALRTALQTLIPALIAALAVLPPLIQSILGDQSVTGWLRGSLTIAAAGIAVAAGIVSKVMNVPGVNAWLTSIGIGARPAPTTTAPGDLSNLDKLDGLGKLGSDQITALIREAQPSGSVPDQVFKGPDSPDKATQ